MVRRQYYPRYGRARAPSAKQLLAVMNQAARLKRARYIRRRWPAKDYARVFMKRGEVGTKELFGDSYTTASDTQKMNRKLMGMRGKGGNVAPVVPQAPLVALDLPRRPIIVDDVAGESYLGEPSTKRARVESRKRIFAPGLEEIQEARKRLRRVTNGVYGAGLYMGGTGGYWAQKLGFKKGGFFDRLADSVTPLIPGGEAIASGTAALHQAITGGQGDYSTNDIVQAGATEFSPPRFIAGDGTSIVLSSREYISDVYGPPSDSLYFQNRAIRINPGLENCFPWLSQVAANYEEYELKQLIFTFKSTIAEIGASTTGQVGQVIMATQYDVNDEPFTDKDTMLRYALSESCKATDSSMHGVECDPSKLSGAPGKFVRSAPVVVGGDPKQYDWGQFNIAVANMPAAYANQSVGELWVSYTVELRKPKITSAKGLTIQTDLYGNDYTAGQSKLQDGPFLTVDGVISPQLLHAQQNSIGTLLSPSPTGPGANQSTITRITFPASYAGNVEILMCLRSSNIAGWTNMILTPNGNIHPIADVSSCSSGTYTSHFDSVSVAPYAGALQFVSVQHFSVGLAQEGQENWVELSYTYDDATDSTHDKLGEFMSIREYNRSLNVRQDGTNDAVLWVNSQGVPTAL